ncbi:CYTH domain-containing protein [Crenobacter caeni]|uniref:CYTH domain-containing protein n=1 Tax=Crenobacter caeni TaxID=2705474 RepID=A0A6B2KSN8_9NEIS|nr:CYTH domain-containing protein [Crenobacter caeni]NDV12957.1 CYTH domain-containing protein [Crenobacter caeni]
MAQEIERKFRVAGEFRGDAVGAERITQGYLCSVPERTVRVRIKGSQGYLTIKGIGNETGAARYEWEQAIPLADAQELLALCEPGVIDKVRHRVPVGGHVFEVDEFFGENAGLVVAEVELTSEDEAFERPPWLGEEVTGDARYYNAVLMKQPFCRW